MYLVRLQMNANLEIESMLIPPNLGYRNNKYKMKNMSTTLEIPEGSKATIQGKVIDGKNYLVVEVEQESEKSGTPEWKKFKRGDVLISSNSVLIFDKYERPNKASFASLINNGEDECGNLSDEGWASDAFRIASNEQRKKFLDWLREEKGLGWDGEKLVEFLREGDMCIFWYSNPSLAFISIYKHFVDGSYVDHLAMYWDNALKWDGTKEQYEKVLRGEL